MKLILTATIILGLISCGDTKKQTPKQEIIKVDSLAVVQNENNEPASAEMTEKLQSYAYDSSVYNEYLSADLKNYLTTNLKNWKLPDPSEWDNLWFQTYKSPNSLVNFISGDFNCDQQKDYALLMSNKNDSSIAAWVIQSHKDGFTSIKLKDYGKFDNHIQLGLEMIEAGDLNYIDPDIDDTRPIKIKCQAVQVGYFEKASTTYYWDKDKYNSVQTGD